MEIGFNPAVSFRAAKAEESAKKTSTIQSPVSTDLEKDSVEIAAKSDKKDAAHAFANYISSKDVQLKTYQFDNDYFPTNLEAISTSEVLSNESFVAFNRQCELGGNLQTDIPSAYWSALQNAGVLIGYRKEINKDNFQASMEYIVKQMKKDTEGFYN